MKRNILIATTLVFFIATWMFFGWGCTHKSDPWLESLQEDLESYYGIGNVNVYSDVQPNISKGYSWDTVSLVNNPNAKDVTWEELVSFIGQDETDSHYYSDNSELGWGIFTCSWFSEQVHNNAEGVGIRAAFVIVNFKEGIGHGLNAFYTTDLGLVFIDCTGEDIISILTIQPPVVYVYGESVSIGDTNNYDKVAYIEIGKPIGLITLGCPYGFSYADYEQWKIDVRNMEQTFNQATTSSSLYALKEKSDRDLGSFWEEDYSAIVESIEIYW